ncbi:MAG: hypothetical protein EBS01_10100 [Verrucomicrobia bacterium]|nr:hypothetical protein [Verrucomicrobiota bacterium]
MSFFRSVSHFARPVLSLLGPRGITALLPLALTLLAGCQSTDPRFTSQPTYLGGYKERDAARANFDNYSHWDGDGVTGAPRVVIQLRNQRAYFYKNGVVVGVSTISTGREGFGTPTGAFKILAKDKDHKSSLYGDYVDSKGLVLKRDIERGKDPMPAGAKFDGAKMPYFMRITGGVGMHVGFLPGYPASHGCIRMPAQMAEAFFRNVEVGTPVTIEP